MELVSGVIVDIDLEQKIDINRSPICTLSLRGLTGSNRSRICGSGTERVGWAPLLSR